MITGRAMLKRIAATGVIAGTSGLAMAAIARNKPGRLGYRAEEHRQNRRGHDIEASA